MTRASRSDQKARWMIRLTALSLLLVTSHGFAESNLQQVSTETLVRALCERLTLSQTAVTNLPALNDPLSAKAAEIDAMIGALQASNPTNLSAMERLISNKGQRALEHVTQTLRVTQRNLESDSTYQKFKSLLDQLKNNLASIDRARTRVWWRLYRTATVNEATYNETRGILDSLGNARGAIENLAQTIESEKANLEELKQFARSQIDLMDLLMTRITARTDLPVATKGRLIDAINEQISLLQQQVTVIDVAVAGKSGQVAALILARSEHDNLRFVALPALPVPDTRSLPAPAQSHNYSTDEIARIFSMELTLLEQNPGLGDEFVYDIGPLSRYIDDNYISDVDFVEIVNVMTRHKQRIWKNAGISGYFFEDENYPMSESESGHFDVASANTFVFQRQASYGSVISDRDLTLTFLRRSLLRIRYRTLSEDELAISYRRLMDLIPGRGEMTQAKRDHLARYIELLWSEMRIRTVAAPPAPPQSRVLIEAGAEPYSTMEIKSIFDSVDALMLPAKDINTGTGKLSEPERYNSTKIANYIANHYISDRDLAELIHTLNTRRHRFYYDIYRHLYFYSKWPWKDKEVKFSERERAHFQAVSLRSFQVPIVIKMGTGITEESTEYSRVLTLLRRAILKTEHWNMSAPAHSATRLELKELVTHLLENTRLSDGQKRHYLRYFDLLWEMMLEKREELESNRPASGGRSPASVVETEMVPTLAGCTGLVDMVKIKSPNERLQFVTNMMGLVHKTASNDPAALERVFNTQNSNLPAALAKLVMQATMGLTQSETYREFSADIKEFQAALAALNQAREGGSSWFRFGSRTTVTDAISRVETVRNRLELYRPKADELLASGPAQRRTFEIALTYIDEENVYLQSLLEWVLTKTEFAEEPRSRLVTAISLRLELIQGQESVIRTYLESLISELQVIQEAVYLHDSLRYLTSPATVGRTALPAVAGSAPQHPYSSDRIASIFADEKIFVTHNPRYRRVSAGFEADEPVVYDFSKLDQYIANRDISDADLKEIVRLLYKYRQKFYLQKYNVSYAMNIFDDPEFRPEDWEITFFENANRVDFLLSTRFSFRAEFPLGEFYQSNSDGRAPLLGFIRRALYRTHYFNLTHREFSALRGQYLRLVAYIINGSDAEKGRKQKLREYFAKLWDETVGRRSGSLL